MKEENLSLNECSKMLTQVSKSLKERNSELSDIVTTIANDVIERANLEEYENDIITSSKKLLEVSKTLEKYNKPISDIILNISDVVSKIIKNDINECECKEETKNVINQIKVEKPKIICGEENCNDIFNNNSEEATIRSLVDKIRKTYESKS